MRLPSTRRTSRPLLPAGEACASSGLGREFADPKRVASVDTKKVERPLAFVTVGRPGEKAAKVIEAYRAQVGAESRAR
jgi:hypothetical protein